MMSSSEARQWMQAASVRQSKRAGRAELPPGEAGDGSGHVKVRCLSRTDDRIRQIHQNALHMNPNGSKWCI